MANEPLDSQSIGFHLTKAKHPHQITLALFSYVLKKPKTWLLAHPETHLTTQQSEQFAGLAERVEQGEPLPYLIGKQEFYGIDFKVDPSVLIPRPETELLVEEALAWLRAHPAARSGIDVGTGSGCIAIALMVNCPDLRMVATDISSPALQLASQNALAYHLEERISFVCCDLLPDGAEPVDLICANLPYIPTAKLEEVNSLPWEPSLALDGGTGGLDLIQKLLIRAKPLIKTPGLILLETEASLGKQTLELAGASFPQAKISLIKDLNDRDRLIRIELLDE